MIQNLQTSCVAAYILTATGGSLQAFTTADADAIFEAHNRDFYRVENGQRCHMKRAEGQAAKRATAAASMESAFDGSPAT